MFKTASPYIKFLLQHPVNWLPFEEKTLNTASKEDKLIFIHIGQMGNVQERVASASLFTDPEVANELNNYFISIPIDIEDYPEAYLLGWDILQLRDQEKSESVNLFLMPDFTPITCTSNCPPEDFLLLTENLVTAFNEKREALTGMAEEAKYLLLHSGVINQENFNVEISKRLLEEYTDDWSMKMISFDNYYKNPPFYLKTPSLLFLSDYISTHPQPVIKGFIHTLCSRIIDSPMIDPLDGGFFFKMEDCKCKKPLYEKRLADNLLVAHFFAKAYRIFSNERYKTAAVRAISFIESTLKAPEGGYYNSLTLNENHLNYYQFSIKELKQLFPERWEEVGNALCMDLTAVEGLKQTISNSLEAEKLPQEEKDALLAHRRTREGIIIDMRKVTANNSLYISTLCDISSILDHYEYVDKAIENHQYMMRFFHNKKENLTRYEQSDIEGILLDWAEFIGADVSLYKATKEDYYLTQAKEYMDHTIECFYNDMNGMFFKSPKYSSLIPLKRESNIDSNIGSTNSIICRDLLQLYNETGINKYIYLAAKQLSNIAPHIPETGPYMGNWAAQLLYFLSLSDKQ